MKTKLRDYVVYIVLCVHDIVKLYVGLAPLLFPSSSTLVFSADCWFDSAPGLLRGFWIDLPDARPRKNALLLLLHYVLQRRDFRLHGRRHRRLRQASCRAGRRRTSLAKHQAILAADSVLREELPSLSTVLLLPRLKVLAKQAYDRLPL